jgi:HTH-like domain
VHQRSRRTYGAPRVHAELRRLNQRCSRKRVARLMRDAGLVGACSPALAARPPGHRTGTGPGQPAVRPAGPGSGVGRGRDPVPHRPGLALPRRGHRSLQPPVVGWAMSDRPDTDLVTDALMMAFPRRRPDRRVVHHSDRGAVLYVAGVQPPAHRARPGPVLRIHQRRPRQRRSRGLLGHPQTRARLDPPAHNLVHPDRATHRRVRPHRGVLQPRAHPTPPRPPQPPPPTRRPPPPLETPCPPNRGKTTSAPKGLGGVWSAGRGRV